VGTRLRWGVIRDSDANIPEVKAHHIRTAENLRIPVFYQWERYSIENYFLEPELLLAAARKQREQNELDLALVKTVLEAAVKNIEDEVSGPFVVKTQTAYRSFEIDSNPFDAGASAATRFLRDLVTLESKIAAYPGKKIFGAFVETLQNRIGINLRLEDVVAELTPMNAPDELRECFTKLQEI
jgi:hypothetical protein